MAFTEKSISTAPGMNVYLTDSGFSNVSMSVRELEYEHFGYALDKAEQAEQDDAVISKLRLHNGIYQVVLGGLQLYGVGIIVPDGSQVRGISEPLGLAYDDTIRLQGDRGEYWQNRNFQPPQDLR